MQKINGWESVQESGSRKFLPAGGYICKIVDVKDEPQKQYMKIEYDIAQGEWKDYALTVESERGWWPLTTVKSYKEKAIGFFKHFISSIEKSNPNFKWDWDENKLVGKLVGVVIGEQEYEKKDGSIGTNMVASDFTPVENIKKGQYKVPDPVKLKRSEPEPSADTDADDGDLPFDFGN